MKRRVNIFRAKLTPQLHGRLQGPSQEALIRWSLDQTNTQSCSCSVQCWGKSARQLHSRQKETSDQNVVVLFCGYGIECLVFQFAVAKGRACGCYSYRGLITRSSPSSLAKPKNSRLQMLIFAEARGKGTSGAASAEAECTRTVSK